MLTNVQVNEYIANGENSFVEFKEGTVRPEQLAKELVAFANWRGGMLLLGVSDEGEIVGLSRSDIEEWVMNICMNRITPAIIPSFQYVKYAEKQIAVIEIGIGIAKPYAVRDGERLTYYIRVGSTSRIADTQQLRRLFQSSTAIHVETMPVNGAAYEHLDFELIKSYFRDVRQFDDTPDDNDEEEWRRLLINNDFMTQTEHGTLVGTIVGTVLFAQTPAHFLPAATVSAVAYKGTKKDYDTAERNDFNLPLSPDSLAKELMLFGQRHLSYEKLRNHLQRKRYWSIPPEALRETLMNALVHRDYTQPGTIEFSIYSDRVEIVSPGSLPNTVTVERMKAGCRVPRNPILIQTMKDYGLVEHMGMGVRNKIIKSMKENSGEEPEFITNEFEIKVILRKIDKKLGEIKKC